MNRIEKHLFSRGAFEDLDFLGYTASEYSDKYTRHILTLRRWMREPDESEAPWVLVRTNGPAYHDDRLVRLWLQGSLHEIYGGKPGYWTGHYKPSVYAIWLLSAMHQSDPLKEGFPETNWSCDDRGHALPDKIDMIEFLVVRGWLKRSHPYLDLTEAGRALAEGYELDRLRRHPPCDFCGEPVEYPQDNLCAACEAGFALQAIDDDDDPFGEDDTYDREAFYDDDEEEESDG